MNPFKFTDRTYNTLLASINAVPELADKPEWFKRMIAGLGDVFSVQNDAAANSSVLPTSFTRDGTQALLKLIDYELGEQVTSNGVQIFNVLTTTPNGTVFTPSDLIASTQGSLTVSAKRYQARSNVTYNLSTSTFVRTTPTTFTTAFDYAYTGKKVRLTTTGTLPAGLSTGTDYYTVYVNATTFSLATSIENAFNGVLISTTDVGVGVHTAELYSFEAVMYQQDERPPVVIGQSDGSTQFQEFDLPDAFVITDTLIITIGGDTYSKVDTLVDSTATDKVYKILNKSDGILTILFGNNEFGIIPPVATDINASYSVGGGALSNQSVLNSVNVYSGTNSEIESTTNGAQYTGGADEENIETAKVRAPILLKAQNRFVTTEDGEALASALGGLSYVKVNSNAFGVLTAQVLAIANGGGNPSATKKSEIKDELESKSILESVTVTVSDATFIAPTVVANIKKKSGFDFSEISTQADLATRLFYTETATEIKDEFTSDGISNAILLINNVFATSFTSSDESWISVLLTALEPIEFGQSIDSSDAVSYIRSNVAGVDSVAFTSPTFPISLNDDEITTHTGISITINEVT